MTQYLDSVTCPLTGRVTYAAEIVDLGTYRIAHIKDSFLWTTINLPDNKALERAYQSFDAGVLSRHHFDEYVSQATSILERELGRSGLAKNRFPELRMLDYGCGGGHFVAAAERLGMRAIGIELDSDAAMAAREKGLNVVCGSLPADIAAIENHTFDVIKLMHVLEHVPNPRSLIQSLVSVLAPGGVFIISVPDQESFPSNLKIMLRLLGIRKYEYGFVQPPIHLHGFSANSFKVITESNSLELVYIDRYSPLDRRCFPSTKEYWSGLGIQKLVYIVGRLVRSGGYLTVVLRRSNA